MLRAAGHLRYASWQPHGMVLTIEPILHALWLELRRFAWMPVATFDTMISTTSLLDVARVIDILLARLRALVTVATLLKTLLKTEEVSQCEQIRKTRQLQDSMHETSCPQVTHRAGSGTCLH